MNARSLQRIVLSLAFATTLAGASLTSAHAQSTPSNASGASLAISVILPAALISGAGQYVIKGVEASAQGTVYVVENISNGVRGSVTVAANISGAASVGVGESVRFVTTTSGMLLVAAGKVLAIIPNELGRALMKSEKLS